MMGVCPGGHGTTHYMFTRLLVKVLSKHLTPAAAVPAAAAAAHLHPVSTCCCMMASWPPPPPSLLLEPPPPSPCSTQDGAHKVKRRSEIASCAASVAAFSASPSFALQHTRWCTQSEELCVIVSCAADDSQLASSLP